MEWNYIVIFISALLAIFLVVKEIRRRDHKNLTGRLIASIVAVNALALIALPPVYQQTKSITGDRTIVLLTDGFNKDSLSAFTDPLIISTDLNLLKASGAKDQIHIPAIDYYLAENPDVQTLHILGTGLPNEELMMLNKKTVRFRETSKVSGFQKINWQRRINSGDELRVSGSYDNSRGKDVKIQLIGLGSTLDSATISADSVGSFQLKCIPRQLGTAINYLVVTSGKDTLSKEKVPFEVEPIKPLSILFLSSAPDFEVSFLTRWLAGNNFSIAVRNKISEQKFSTEFLNMDQVPISIQSRVLEKFDVLITDETSINQLSNPERQALDKQVNNGLGLLIRDEEEVKLPEFFGVSFPAFAMADNETLSVKMPGNNLQVIVPGKSVNYLAAQAYDQPLAWDNSNRILVNSTASGLGRIIFSTLNNTYFLKLSGKSREYSAYWSYLIEKAVSKNYSTEQVQIADQFPVVHQKTSVFLQSEKLGIPTLFADETEISMEQDENLPYLWTGFFWPDRSGWNTLQTASSEKNRVFVFSPIDWLSVRKLNYLQSTRHFAKKSANATKRTGVQETKVNQQLPPLFFYLLLLLICCSYLWIETKFL